MNKQELRIKYKNLRAQLDPEEREQWSIALANQLLKIDIWKGSYYHIFLPIERLGEVNTTPLMSILGGKDKNILLPKSDFLNHTMQSILLTDSTMLSVNSYGIAEPEDGIVIEPSMIDVVFIPLLAFDRKGNRLGYGKGFYDRFLATCRPDVIKVGLSYFEVEKTLIDANVYDVPLNYCITPKNVYKF